MFLDSAIIDVTGGQGGRGCVSWRREKYEPMGGPDGGDGGRGGDVVIQADENTDTLSDFASRKRFEADKGKFGMGKNRHGKDGEDLILLVPPGTVISQVQVAGQPTEEDPFHADLIHHGDRVVVARGGRGGYGNAHFKSSVRQRPDFAELGEPGTRLLVELELKLVADVGIIGYPSVGKSTLISVISGARPKIAAYPFTTLVPNLGVVRVDDRGYVVCDVPGLIEGASEGKGLGDKFLRHIERCRVLLHVLDLSRAMVLEEGGGFDIGLLRKDYDAIRKELAAYSPTLAAKKELIVLNKTDLAPDRIEEFVSELESLGITLFAHISAATKHGTDEMTKKLLPIVLEERARVAKEEDEGYDEPALPVLRPHLTSQKMGAYRIDKDPDGAVRVRGKRLEQFTKMTDFGNRGAVERFKDVIERIGLERAIARLRGSDQSPVFIGQIRIDAHL